MKYILDFDRTLFDTDSFISQVEADGKRSILVTTEIWSHYNARDFLYKDVLDWLLSKNKSDIQILTAVTADLGDKADSFQREKLNSANLKKFVSSTTFVTGEKGQSVAEIAKQFPLEEKLVFVDDRIEQCLSVKETMSEVICCLMVRDKSLIGEVKMVNNLKVVSTLADVDVIMSSI